MTAAGPVPLATIPTRPRRSLAPVGLLAPAVATTVAIFWVAMAILLAMSLYPFVASGPPAWTLEHWRRFLGDPYYWGVVRTTLELGAWVTAGALVIGYPTAYAMARLRRPGVLLAVYLVLFAPILVSVVVRTYGWLLVLSKTGFVNYLLLRAGLVQEPVALIFNTTGIVIAMVHILLPFMVFPVLSVMTQLGSDLREAAMDLGATRWQTFCRVTLPLTLPGIVSGCQIVFTLTVSAFVTPFLMGGGKIQILSGLVYRDMEAVNLAFAAVVSFVLLGLSVVVLVASNRLTRHAHARAELASP